MTVQELINKLETMPKDKTVLVPRSYSIPDVEILEIVGSVKLIDMRTESRDMDSSVEDSVCVVLD